ncbi:MAG: hypothetical protein NXY57DRAFT_28101 [Lentinula lateritia]|nr:MAG: hypothetical protein NXY57DRAFT_28101 [Lentinula lateritia]
MSSVFTRGDWDIVERVLLVFFTYLTYLAFIEFPTPVFEDNSPSFFFSRDLPPFLCAYPSCIISPRTDLSQTLPTAPSLLYKLKAGVCKLHTTTTTTPLGAFGTYIYRFCGFSRVKRGVGDSPLFTFIFFLRVVIPTLNFSSSSTIPSPPPSSYPFIPSGDSLTFPNQNLNKPRAKFRVGELREMI